jgi:hypothetical protein
MSSELRFHCTVGAAPAGLRDVRQAFGRWLEHQGLGGDVRSELVLVASELCAAALRVIGDGSATLVVQSWFDGDAIVVEVHDPSRALQALDRRLPGLGDGDAGRALSIVALLTDVLTVRTIGRSPLLRARRERIRGFAPA